MPPASRTPNALTLLLLALGAATYFAPFGDLDWSWQVRTGEQIVRTRSLHVADAFSYTIAGRDLPDHEWLYEVAVWAMHDAFGAGGLKLLRVLFAVASLGLVVRRLARAGVPAHANVALLLLSILVLAPSWNLRPLFVTTLGLLLVSGWLHEHCAGGRRVPWTLPFVMLVWANAHPGVIAGQGLLFGALAWETANRVLKWNAPLDGPRWRRLMLVGGLGLAATFVCPDPLGRVRYAFDQNLAHPIHRILVEMTPTWRVASAPPYNFAPIYAVALAALFAIAVRLRRWRVWELAYLAVLTLLGNFAARGAMDWYLNLVALSVPHLAAVWKEALARPRRLFVRPLVRVDQRTKRLLAGPLFRLQPIWLAGALGSATLVSLVPPLSRAMPKQTADEWPAALADAFVEAGFEGNVFAPPMAGAYLGWRTQGRAKVYVDTRTFFFPPTLVEDSHHLPRLDPGWDSRLTRVLDEHATDWFVLPTVGEDGALWRALEPSVTALHRDAEFALVSAAEVRAALGPSRSRGGAGR